VTQGRTISVGPDKPAILADRLVRRLLKDGLIEPGPTPKGFERKRAAITESLADEIHQDILDATLRSKR